MTILNDSKRLVCIITSDSMIFNVVDPEMHPLTLPGLTLVVVILKSLLEKEEETKKIS